MERIDNIDTTLRREGCKAVLYDDGIQQKVPTCMGGIAVTGCNNYEHCMQVSDGRWVDTIRGRVIQRDESGVVISETTVRRGVLTSDEVRAAVTARIAVAESGDIDGGISSL